MVEIRRCNSEKIAERQSVCVCERERGEYQTERRISESSRICKEHVTILKF